MTSLRRFRCSMGLKEREREVGGGSLLPAKHTTMVLWRRNSSYYHQSPPSYSFEDKVIAEKNKTCSPFKKAPCTIFVHTIFQITQYKEIQWPKIWWLGSPIIHCLVGDPDLSDVFEEDECRSCHMAYSPILLELDFFQIKFLFRKSKRGLCREHLHFPPPRKTAQRPCCCSRIPYCDLGYYVKSNVTPETFWSLVDISV